MVWYTIIYKFVISILDDFRTSDLGLKIELINYQVSSLTVVFIEI